MSFPKQAQEECSFYFVGYLAVKISAVLFGLNGREYISTALDDGITPDID
jgi:hypothetical protein